MPAVQCQLRQRMGRRKSLSTLQRQRRLAEWRRYADPRIKGKINAGQGVVGAWLGCIRPSSLQAIGTAGQTWAQITIAGLGRIQEVVDGGFTRLEGAAVQVYIRACERRESREPKHD